MRPSLPSRPSKDVDKISASWLCKLLDCVAYGMTNPRGDGKTILNESAGTLRAVRQPGGGTDSGADQYTLFEVVKDSDTSVKINGYNSEEGRYYNNWCVFGLRRVEVEDGATVSNIDSTGVIYLKATYSDGLGGEGGQGEEGWTVTVEFSAGLPQQDSSCNIRYLADVIMTDGKITAINQPPTGIIYFPPYLESYATDKKMVLIVDNGVYKWVEIGDCNA